MGNEEYRVEHIDISPGNFVVDPKTLDVKLRDFDLARLVRVEEQTGPQGMEKMGATALMAWELLTSQYWEGTLERLYQHELEAFVWVVVFCAWAFDDEGHEVAETPVHAWFTADYNDCRTRKGIFLVDWWKLLPDHVFRRKHLFNYVHYLLSWLIRLHRRVGDERYAQIRTSRRQTRKDRPLVVDVPERDVHTVFERFWKETEAGRPSAEDK